MCLAGAELQFRPLLLAVALRPGREARSLGTVDAQPWDSVDELEQLAGQTPHGVQPAVVGADLPEPEDRGHQQRQQAEGGRQPSEPGVAPGDEHEHGQQEHHRQHPVADHAACGVAPLLERHAPHGQVVGRVPPQHAGRQPQQPVPERGFHAGRGATLDAHQGHAVHDVEQGAGEAEGHQGQTDPVDEAGIAGWDRLVRDQAERHGRQQHDQAAQESGHHEAGQIGAQSRPCDAPQVAPTGNRGG